MIVDALFLAARANLAGSVAIAAVALLRRPVRSIFGAPAGYCLWAIPLVMALASLVPAPEGGLIAPIALSATSGLRAAASLRSGSLWPASVGGIWALGAIIYATLLGAQQMRFASALRGGSTASVGGTLVIRAARTDIGPAVVGRAIILPRDFEARFTRAEQAAILAHEAQHLARGDVLANAVVALIQCLCWFNPFVHLAARWIRFDQEFACDAAVIADQPALRRPYAEALLKTQVMAAIPPAGCAWRARGFPALRDRIRFLKQRAPSPPRRASGALLLAALTLGGGYAAWAAQPPQGRAVAHPDWSRRPIGSDLVRFYPREALARRLGGMAVIQCRVDRTGALSACAILREGPQGLGFGNATLQMAPLFQMKPMSVNGRPVAGGIVRIPVKFELPPTQAGRS
ncbi:MAG: TonB family protein [Caulobacterales bacterium]|jgi:TonB family protein